MRKLLAVGLSLALAAPAGPACVLKQSTAKTIRVGPFVDKTDGVTEEVGLATTGTELSKDGGAYAAGPTLGTHDAEGWYPLALTSGNTDTLGELLIKVHDVATHLPLWRSCTVLTANVFDSLYGTGDVLDVSTIQFNGSAVIQSGGRPEVNTTHWAGGATATDDVALATAPTNFALFEVNASGQVDVYQIENVDATNQINSEVDVALDTAIPTTPTTDSINERVKTLDDNYTAARAPKLDNADVATSTRATPAQVGTELDNRRLDELASADSDLDGAQPPAVGSYFFELMSKSTGSFTFDQTTESTEALRDQLSTYAGGDTAGTTTLLSRIPGVVQPQTGDSYARLGVPTGASTAADIAAVKTDTGNLVTRIPDGDLDIMSNRWLSMIQLDGADYEYKPSALEEAPGASDPTVLQSTVIATLGSQTSLTLTAGSGDDNAYNEAIAIFVDASTPTQKAAVAVLDYTGSTKTVTLAEAPAFTIAAGDTIHLVATGQPWDVAMADHLLANSTGSKLNSAAAAGDPLSASCPGAYTGNQVGALICSKLPQIGSLEVSWTGPYTETGEVVVTKGDDTTLDWVNSTGNWDTLTGASITLYVYRGQVLVLQKTGSIILPTGAPKQVRVTLTNTETASFTPDKHDYVVKATWTGPVIKTLARGDWQVIWP